MSGKRSTPSSGNVFADLGLPHAEQLLGSADKLHAMLDALRLAHAALKRAEWSNYDRYDTPCCPDCYAMQDNGHDGDCGHAAALAAIRALLPDVGEEEG